MNEWDPVNCTVQSWRRLWEVVVGGWSEKHKEEAEVDRAGRTVRTLDTNKLCVCIILVGGQSCPMRTRPTALSGFPSDNLVRVHIQGASDVIGAWAGENRLCSITNRDLHHLITQRTRSASPWGPHQRG